MGGSGSHQFTVPCESGEDTIVYTEDGSYAANLERAAVDAPSVILSGAKNLPTPKEVHTPNVGSIDAVCAFLKTQPKDMIKTIICRTPSLMDEVRKERLKEKAKHDGRDSLVQRMWKRETIAVLIRGDHDINPEKLTQVLGGVHFELADEATIEKVTSAKVGFAGPIGIADKVSMMIIDHAVAAMVVAVSGANKTDYHTKNVVPGRDFPLEGDNVTVTDIRYAGEGDTHNGKKLLFKKGIEVGQVFKLGTKYSEKLGAKFLRQDGREAPCLMGCYGIGINRILASAIELGNDDNGIIWPISIAPFEVLVTSVNQDDDKVAQVAEDIYKQLLGNGIDVLLDDRILRGGVKFKDADLIGIPIRVTVGKKSVAKGNVEIKLRCESQSQKVPIEKAADKTIELVNSLKERLMA